MGARKHDASVLGQKPSLQPPIASFLFASGIGNCLYPSWYHCIACEKTKPHEHCIRCAWVSFPVPMRTLSAHMKKKSMFQSPCGMNFIGSYDWKVQCSNDMFRSLFLDCVSSGLNPFSGKLSLVISDPWEPIPGHRTLGLYLLPSTFSPTFTRTIDDTE